MEGFYGKSERAKDLERKISSYRGLSAAETKRRILADQEEEESHESGGNTGLPFGLCKKYGISLPERATPRDAWAALKDKTGMSPKDFYEKLQDDEKKSESAKGSKTGSIDKCRTFDELSDYFDKNYGAFVGLSVHDLDYETCHTALKGVDRIMREFPQAQEVLYGISTENSGIMCTKPNGEICFNPKYFTNERLAEEKMQLGRAMRFFPQNADVLSAGAHEMGHILELALARKAYGNGIEERIAWAKGTFAKKVVLSACKVAKQKTGQTYDDMKFAVSGYARKGGYSECLAECVSDYFTNGENASPLSLEVWKILKEELG